MSQTTSFTSTTITSPAGRTVTIVKTSSKVTSWTNGSETYTYAYADSGDTRTTTITGPGSVVVRTLTSSISKLLILTDKDALNRTTTYTYDGTNRLTRITYPEGNYVNYTYDSRGNITLTRLVAKSGSGLSDITTSATYPSTCSNPVTCNKPTSTTNALGVVTDYTYDSTHGGVLTVTAPAPAVGATRPQTRYTYGQKYAWVKTSGGAWAQEATPIYVLTDVSACSTGSSCTGTSAETKTTITYQSGSISAGSNILPISTSSGSGDGALTATSAVTYDANGDVLSVDGPLSGADDTYYARYDVIRRAVGTISPDPDGANSMKRRAVKTTYDADSLPTLVERGTVNGLTDPDWAAFATLDQTATTYDTAGRATKSWFASGGTTYGLVQASYDAKGRPECTALRMNPAIFGSLPGSACTLGTAGSNGPDRITKAVYDNADQVLQKLTAYGTAAQATEMTATYSNNGRLTTLADANGNLTTYEYDGFDRPKKQRYPNTSGGGSSTSDYEQQTYDAAGNVTQLRRRDSQTIDFTYDALNRIKTQSAPSTSWTYDNLSRTTAISDGTNTLGWTYDALGRATAKTDTFGTWGYQYDLANRRTRLTYPDSFYIQYDYLVTGEMRMARENGTWGGLSILGYYAYDDLGNSLGVLQANGNGTRRTYDPASRLLTLAIANDNLSPTDLDGKTFTYSPAGQIINQSNWNSAYVFSGTTPAGTFTINGLNQAVTFSAASLTYDGRGNLTSDGTATYSYDIANRLSAKVSGPSFAYDPAGRLAQVTGASTTKFAYDGGRIIAEYDGTGALLRRYVPGAGVDETLVWYEGSGTTDRRWLMQDERRSVTTITDDSGTVLATNTYDEYGNPGSGNMGRFQYTGQAWIAEIGLYYYKARFYSPTLRRFMQPDPIGYGDGMAIYAYVGGDPMNFGDPSGLDASNETVLVRANRPPKIADVIMGFTVTDVRQTRGPFISGTGERFAGAYEAEVSTRRRARGGGGSNAGSPRGTSGSNNGDGNDLVLIGRDFPMPSPLSAETQAMITQGLWGIAKEVAFAAAGGWVLGKAIGWVGGHILAEANALLPSAIAAIGRQSIIIGQNPYYVDAAAAALSRAFTLPASVRWTWAANEKFLQRAIQRGDTIFGIGEARAGSVYADELAWLGRMGYRVIIIP